MGGHEGRMFYSVMTLASLDSSDICFWFPFEKVTNQICWCYNEVVLTEVYFQNWKINTISGFLYMHLPSCVRSSFSVAVFNNVLTRYFFCLSLLFFHYENMPWVATGPIWSRLRPNSQLRSNSSQPSLNELKESYKHIAYITSWVWFVPYIVLAIAKWSTAFGRIWASVLERNIGILKKTSYWREK